MSDRIKELYDSDIIAITDSGDGIEFMEACDHWYKLKWSKAEAQEFIDELQLMVDRL